MPACKEDIVLLIAEELLELEIFFKYNTSG